MIAAMRCRRAGIRPAVAVRTVDEPLEHDAGEIFRIVVADSERRQHLLALQLDLLGCKRRVLGDVGHHVQPHVEAVLHDDRLHEGEFSAGARAEHAADRIDAVLNLLGGLRRRALIEQRRGQRRHARLVRRILRAAGADHQPDADGRLLVMRHRDHLEAVAERLQRIGRELDVARRQRPRRPLRRPVGHLRR